jgi:hypothetical protein
MAVVEVFQPSEVVADAHATGREETTEKRERIVGPTTTTTTATAAAIGRK